MVSTVFSTVNILQLVQSEENQLKATWSRVERDFRGFFFSVVDRCSSNLNLKAANDKASGHHLLMQRAPWLSQVLTSSLNLVEFCLTVTLVLKP